MLKHQYLFGGKSISEIEAALYLIVNDSLCRKYGETPDELIVKRVKQEWASMERSGVILDVAALYELTVWLKNNHHPYRMRALSGSSFILYKDEAKCIKLSNLSLMFVLNPEKILRYYYEQEFTASDLGYIMQNWRHLVQYFEEENDGIQEPA